MHNIYSLNNFRKAKSSPSKTFQQAVDNFSEDTRLGEIKPEMPIYKIDMDEVFSRALIRLLGEFPGDYTGSSET
jgi:hypothetical protein